MSNGNVFVFSFSNEGFEAIVNLTQIDQTFVMARMGGEKLPQTVNSILSMMELRARYYQQRNMEVWLVKLDDGFTEDELIKMADEDPQMVADIARMGENIIGEQNNNKVIT